jgi:Fe-S-cluster containining protein
MATQLARRKKFAGEKFLKFRCTDCGNCCTDTIVPITGDDLQRLQKGIGLKAGELAEFYKTSEFADEGDGLHLIQLDLGPRIMGLRKRYDEKEEREACKFYKDQRCTVYEHRPVTCRVWPFTLSFDSTGKRITRMEINDALPCPYELDGSNQPQKLVEDWNWDDEQDLHYEKQVKEWNESKPGGSAEEFFRFLKLEA